MGIGFVFFLILVEIHIFFSCIYLQDPVLHFFLGGCGWFCYDMHDLLLFHLFVFYVFLFNVFLFFLCVFKPEEGTWILVVSWRTQLCTLPLRNKFSMFDFFECFENSAKVREFWSSLGGPHSATYWQQALGSYS